MRNRRNLGRKAEGRRGRARSSRRGVLLLVVLSMLVLFMLVGTAFMMSSSLGNKASKGNASLNRVGNNGTKLLDRCPGIAKVVLTGEVCVERHERFPSTNAKRCVRPHPKDAKFGVMNPDEADRERIRIP